MKFLSLVCVKCRTLSYLLETCLKSLTLQRPVFSLRRKNVTKMVLKERGYEGREIYSSSTHPDETAFLCLF